jgi:2-octaprenyl-6-methoxyphenol hydroxylase
MCEQARRYDAIVVGGGPAGLAAAALLAGGRLKVALVAPQQVVTDSRTVALMQPSIRLLKHMTLWPKTFAAVAQPLRKLTLVDDTASYFAAPRLTFSADELGLEAFGWNIPLAELCTRLHAQAQGSGVEMVRAAVAGLECSREAAKLLLENASPLEGTIIIAGDGRDSLIRRASNIKSKEWTYDQSAIAGSFTHSVGHEDISTEYLRCNGPLTTVPLPGHRSSLVWMDRPGRILDLMALSDKDFACELQATMHGELGLISDVGRRQAFPMRGLIASDFGGRRVVLVGEAAHLMPPIGAQGLNISLRDAAMAAELVLDAADAGEDLGSEDLVRNYASLRRQDVLPRQHIIHNYNRSLLADFLPFNLARAAGVAIIGQLKPVRRYVMEQGLEPAAHLPRAMRA